MPAGACHTQFVLLLLPRRAAAIAASFLFVVCTAAVVCWQWCARNAVAAGISKARVLANLEPLSSEHVAAQQQLSDSAGIIALIGRWEGRAVSVV